jgi:outer membrane receptor protein involved in Fe transport
VKSSKFVVLGVLLLGLLSGVSAIAQTSGSVSGTISDETGAVLPGAVVTLSGPALQGSRTATTDAQGKYRFVNIPAGDNYRITATLSGFQTLTKEAIHVYLGQEGTMNLQVKAAMTEAVTVVGEAPLVDVTKTVTGVNITASQFESLPTARNFQQLTTLAPGVTMEMGDHDTRFTTSPNVGSSSAPENNYIIDGLSATDPRFGTSGTNLTMNFVQEVQVMTGGYNAEYGRSTGGVFNVVTKSGGNAIHGDLFTYYRNKSWSPDNIVRRRNKETTTFFNGDNNADFGGSIGGPLVKDKLWFFAAADPTRRTTFIGGFVDAEGVTAPSAGQQFDTDSNIYAAKLTWTPVSNHTVVATAFGDPTTRDGWLGVANSDPGAAMRTERTGSHNGSLRYSGILTPKFLMEMSLGRHQQRNELQPSTDVGRTIPRQIDQTIGGFEHGGFQRDQKDKSTRDSAALKFTNFLGGHEIKYGADLEVNRYDADLHELWYQFFGPAAFANTYVQGRDYRVQGKGTTSNGAAFAQARLKLRPNLRLNLGLRYEEQWLDSAENVAVANKSEADSCIVNLECRTVDKLKLKNNWSPRLELVWDPAGNGKSKLYGFYGRFYEAIPLDLNIRAINGEKYIIQRWGNTRTLNENNWVNPNGSPLAINGTWTLNRTSNLVAVTPLDEALKAQFQNEFVVGGDLQFTHVWSAGVRFVDRELKRVIEDFGTFTNPADPTELTGYVIGNPGEGNFGAQYDKPRRYYRALEFTLQRAKSDNWQLYSSFVYAKAKGNYEGLYISGYDQLDPNITALYDIPSFLPNAFGPLRSDKPFQFKVHSAYTFPMGLTVSEGFFVSSGIPVSAQGPEVVVGYGDGTIFLKPRGSEGRTPTYWSLDLHADYALPLFGKGKGAGKALSIIVDAFNVFNRHEVLERDQDYVYEGMDGIVAWEAANNLDANGNPKFNPNLPASRFFNTPILYQSPRSLQLGVKLTF